MKKVIQLRTKKVIEVRTSTFELATQLVRTEALFEERCSAFEIEVTEGMEMAYEAGFGAALLTLGIDGPALMSVSKMADKIRKEKKDCSCTGCDPESK